MDQPFRFLCGGGAQSSHSGGNLISHLEKAGSNRPPLAIPAEKPVNSVPSEHRRIGWSISANPLTIPPINNSPLRVPPRLVWPPVIVFGVGQSASATCRGNWSSRVRADPSGFVASVAMPGVSFQSRLLAVAQPARGAVSLKPIMPGRGDT